MAKDETRRILLKFPIDGESVRGERLMDEGNQETIWHPPLGIGNVHATNEIAANGGGPLEKGIIAPYRFECDANKNINKKNARKLRDLIQVQIKRSKTSGSHVIKSKFRDLSMPKCTVNDLLWDRLDKWSDNVAVECGVTGKFLTYAQLKTSCDRFAVSLLKLGLQKKDVVAMLLPNAVEFPVVFLGILEAGIRGTPINPLYSEDEISYLIAESNSTVVVTVPAKVPSVRAVAEKLKKPLRIIVVDDNNHPTPASCMSLSSMISSDVGTSDLNKLRHPMSITDTALIPYSSGTTGLPKGVCLTHFSMASNMIQASSDEIGAIPESTKNSQASVPCVVPFCHIYGFAVVMFRTLYMGAKIVSLPKFHPDTFLSVLAANKDIIFYAVPPMIFFLNTYPGIQQKHLDNLQTTMTGGAPCSAKDIEKLQDKKPHRIAQIYGMTEASPLFTHAPKTDPDSERSRVSCGAVLSNTEARIVQPETGEVLLGDQIGELCFRGPQIMKGYHNRPEETKKVLSEDGWLRTGDIGRIDENGHCYIVDRSKELIKVKGFQVAPAELESVLRQHPTVLDVGVTSKPCPKAGERPVAFIVPRKGFSVNLEDIKKFVASKVAPYKVIDDVLLIDEIPKLSSGKIRRTELKKRLASKEETSK